MKKLVSWKFLSIDVSKKVSYLRNLLTTGHVKKPVFGLQYNFVSEQKDRSGPLNSTDGNGIQVDHFCKRLTPDPNPTPSRFWISPKYPK
jgi:hypothetical protein